MEEKPNYLFHYTSVRNLALILKSKQIRLRALNTVDDVSEAKSQDTINYGQYIFVTCWTSLQEESIPFWHIYTSDMAGVRIKMPWEMFIKYPNRDIPEFGVKTDNKGYFALPFEKSHLRNHIVMPEAANNFYHIEYTNDQQLLYRPLYSKQPDGSHSIALGELGRYKSSHWLFQSEWRFRLIVTPGIPMPKDFATNRNAMDQYLSEAAQVVVGKPLGFDEYFLEIDESAFSEMEITLGPKQHPGDEVLVEALVKEYNPDAKIVDSSLKGKVR